MRPSLGERVALSESNPCLNVTRDPKWARDPRSSIRDAARAMPNPIGEMPTPQS